MKKFLFFFVFYAAFVSSSSDENNSLIKYYGKSKNKINIVIKDNIDIEGEVTSAGSLALEKNIAIKNAGLLNLKGFIPADFMTKISLSFWSFKYAIIHPAKVPNGIAIKSQLGKLYADKIKNSKIPAPLLIINLIVLKD